MRFIDPPPSDYNYDPRQSFDPENIPPPPPGYGEKGGNYLLPDENITAPAYLPQNPDGSTSYPQEFGPEPPTFYATNVPDTAKKWGAQGQDYTFLAESPGAMKTAEELGAPRVMKGYDPALDQVKAIGPEPKPGELDDFSKAQSFWKHIVDTEHGGVDPTKINPAEVAMNKRTELKKKYDLELFNRGAGSTEYKEIQKHIDQQVKDVENIAERQRAGASEKRKEVFSFAKAKFAEERKIAAEERKQKGLDTRANVEDAQKYTERALYGPNAWQNYDLTTEDLDKLASDKTYMPKNRKVKKRILTDVNRVRALSGLPPITEKPVQVPMKEFRDWGLFRTGEKTVNEPGYQYEEGQAPARSATPAQGGGPAQVVRTGTHKGQRVIQYSDGRVEYVH